MVCTFVPRPFETDPGALKVPFFHNNDDYDEVIFYHAGNFFSRDNIAPGMMTLHPCGFTHGPHPKALKNMLVQSKPATDEYAVMIDARDALEITPAAQAVEWAGYVDSWKEQMKLATLRNGSRDGQLVVVSRDLTRALPVPHIAATLQEALDDWARVRAAAARRRASRWSRARVTAAFAFDVDRAHGAAAARVSLGRRLGLRESRRARAQGARRRDAGELLDRSAGLPGRLGRFPRRRREDVPVPSEEFGIDLEGEVAVITDDVPMGTTPRPGARSTSSC